MSLSSHQMMWIVPWLKSFRCRPSQFLNHCEEILAMFELRPHHLIHTHWEFPGPNPTGVAWLHPSGRCPVNPNPSFDRTFLPYTVATDLSITIHIVGLRTAPVQKSNLGTGPTFLSRSAGYIRWHCYINWLPFRIKHDCIIFHSDLLQQFLFVFKE